MVGLMNQSWAVELAQYSIETSTIPVVCDTAAIVALSRKIAKSVILNILKTNNLLFKTWLTNSVYIFTSIISLLNSNMKHCRD